MWLWRCCPTILLFSYAARGGGGRHLYLFAVVVPHMQSRILPLVHDAHAAPGANSARVGMSRPLGPPMPFPLGMKASRVPRNRATVLRPFRHVSPKILKFSGLNRTLSFSVCVDR
jgi:hypothetical protein